MKLRGFRIFGGLSDGLAIVGLPSARYIHTAFHPFVIGLSFDFNIMCWIPFLYLVKNHKYYKSFFSRTKRGVVAVQQNQNFVILGIPVVS
ncbi:hypothetical protein V6Z12_D05G076200 [Gossypium hirsutum]